MPKTPSEFYGVTFSQPNLKELKAACQSEACPFLNRKCVKQRKSDPAKTIGSCSLGFNEASLIICPHRFLQGQMIFHEALQLLRQTGRHFIVPEVPMPGGSVDYFVVASADDAIVDYVGLEIQSLDTTGSGGIWDAREDVVRGKLGENYAYGINWKMSAKTILVQMHHKAMSFEALGKKVVLILQREFFDYIVREFRTGHIRPATVEDSVHFHIYETLLEAGGLRIRLHDRRSTNVRGVAEMLALSDRPEITDQDIVALIAARMETAQPLRPA